MSIKRKLMALATSGLFLVAVVPGCSNHKVTHYDKDGKITSVEEVKGTEHTGHGKNKVDFKKSDDAQIVARAQAIKEIGNQTVPGQTTGEALLLKVILSRDITELESQEYGEEAPGTLIGGAGALVGTLVDGALGVTGIIEGADLVGKLADKVGDKQEINGGSGQQGGEHTETVVMTPESEEPEEVTEETKEE